MSHTDRDGSVGISGINVAVVDDLGQQGDRCGGTELIMIETMISG